MQHLKDFPPFLLEAIRDGLRVYPQSVDISPVTGVANDVIKSTAAMAADFIDCYLREIKDEQND
jgi:hypothetical protein